MFKTLKRKKRRIGNRSEELKRKGRSNERDEKELERKQGSNEWKGRVLQRKDGCNEIGELKGKEEQDEQERRVEAKGRR